MRIPDVYIQDNWEFTVFSPSLSEHPTSPFSPVPIKYDANTTVAVV
jgi:hypothetical protein